MTTVIYRGDVAGTGFFYRTAPPTPDKTETAELVQLVVRRVDWTLPRPDGRAPRARTVRNEIMLAVLTYCYALGMYRASEIEAAIARGLFTGGVVDGSPLDRYALIDFRRHHWDILEDCLTRVLGHLMAPSIARGAVNHPPADRAAEEARSRMDRAIEWDCLERDE